MKRPHMYTFEDSNPGAKVHNCRIRTPAITNVTAEDFDEACGRALVIELPAISGAGWAWKVDL
jgi:hypothetical protein